MAKKFFHEHVYNTKRTIINFSIIGGCIIGIIICFIITSNFQAENKNAPKGELALNSQTTIEVNENITNDMFFSKIENVNIDDIEIIYPDNFDISNPGEYEITIKVGKEEKKTKLIIVDTVMPELTLKDLTIKENATYSPKDFVVSCSDNSKHECLIAYPSNATDEDGNSIDYTTYKKEGTYSIKISAKDNAGNENIKEAKLIISNNASTNQEPPQVETKPETCKYGNNEYDKENYVLAIDKTINGCAVSLDKYLEKEMTAEVDKLMETESTRIQKDVNALKLDIDGMLSLNRLRTAVLNNAGTGVVGYQLRVTVTTEINNEIKVIVDYKVDSNGKRVFISNDYNLPS